jgi:alpha-D-ribose 1-methylphosphonate 5-triphosphate synthase subunit PhnH
MTDALLKPGFSQPVGDAQQAFRVLLKVMSEPGVIRSLQQAQGIDHLAPAGMTALLALCDQTTPVWLAPVFKTAAIRTNLNFHAGAPLASDAQQADFVLSVPGELPPLEQLKAGEPEYPDRSCTLVVQLEQLGDAPVGDALVELELSGPGISGRRRLCVSDLGADLLSYLTERPHPFPLGLDLILVSGERVTAIPRTTDVEVI